MTARRWRDTVEEHAHAQREEAQRHLAEELPLFRETLPYAPGSDTSQEAAQCMSAAAVILRRRVLETFAAAGRTGLTPDECAVLLGITVLACRPRCTELRQAGDLERTGARRRNESRMWAAVLRAVMW